MDDYQQFFIDIWSDQAPLFAIVYPPAVDMLGRPVKTEGVKVRVIEGLPKVEYAVERGVTLPAKSRALSLLASELPPTWKPAPGAMLDFRDRQWRIHQDVPPEPLCPDGSIIKIIVHPV